MKLPNKKNLESEKDDQAFRSKPKNITVILEWERANTLPNVHLPMLPKYLI